MSFTVAFAGSVRAVPGNPMTLKTPFGEVEACGITNAFEQVEIMEAALVEIADLPGEAGKRAQKALDEINNLITRELRSTHMKTEPSENHNERSS